MMIGALRVADMTAKQLRGIEIVAQALRVKGELEK